MNPAHLQLLAACLFSIGLVVVITRRNIFFMLMGVELMLNAINLSFVGFSGQHSGENSLIGHIVPLFIIGVAAAEACVGLAMVICLFRGRGSLDVDDYAAMKE